MEQSTKTPPSRKANAGRTSGMYVVNKIQEKAKSNEKVRNICTTPQVSKKPSPSKANPTRPPNRPPPATHSITHKRFVHTPEYNESDNHSSLSLAATPLPPTTPPPPRELRVLSERRSSPPLANKTRNFSPKRLMRNSVLPMPMPSRSVLPPAAPAPAEEEKAE